MERLILIFEIIGTISFALTGAMTGLKKQMDIFGVCVLGVTTAVGGGIIRDLILGLTPPSAFRDPTSVLIAIAVSIIVFFPAVRRIFYRNKWLYEHVLLLADSAGLGIFTVCGARVAMEAGDGANRFLVIFVAALTGVGGGVLRDLFAGDRPYIFVKHVYACSALLGAPVSAKEIVPMISKINISRSIVVTVFYVFLAGRDIAMLAGFVLVFAMRLCSAHFRWSLPHARRLAEEEEKTS